MKKVEDLDYTTDAQLTVFVNEAIDFVIWIDHSRRLIRTVDGINEEVTGSERRNLLILHNHELFL